MPRWLKTLRTWRRMDRDMDNEFQSHIQLRADDLMRQGVAPNDARRQARLEFGSMEHFREEGRAAHGAALLDSVRGDTRHALRSLRRSPGFAAAAVLTLALGVGVNAAVFSLVSATLLRPLPFPDADRLVMLYQTRAEAPDRRVRWSYPEFAALEGRLTTVERVAAYYASDVNIATDGDAERVSMEIVSPSYFDALAVPAVRGRTFLPEQGSAGDADAAILSHRVWAGAFGADERVLGERVVLNGVAARVVGVMPENFHGLSGDIDVWITHALAPYVYFPDHLVTSQKYLTVIGSLAPGVRPETARTEVRSRATTLAAAVRAQIGSDEGSPLTATLLPLQQARRDPATVQAQLVLAGAVFFVLLIAAVNVSALLLARAVGRARETAVRTALGAGRARLMRASLVESALIGLAGGVVGVLLTVWLIRVLSAMAPAALGGAQSRLSTMSSFSAPVVDWRVLTFALTIAVGAGLMAGIVAALRGTRGDLTHALRSGARGSGAVMGSLRRPTLLSTLAVAQVALALVLLSGAGLLLEGFLRLRSADPGVDAAAVLTFRVSPPDPQYQGLAAGELHSRLLERIAAVPGVIAASVGRCTPFGGGCSTTPLFLADAPLAGDPPIVGRHYVGPDHFRTLGVPLLRGRMLTDRDRAGSPRVAVINETAARRFWPGEDPLGKRVWFGSGGGFASPDSLTTIVGVVRDVPYQNPGEPVEPDFYTSYLQHTFAGTTVFVRVAADPLALVGSLRSAVAEVDPALPIHDVRTLSARGRDALVQERFATATFAVFTVLGLVLASLGVYGVVAYAVAQRRREIGIRKALGATTGTVLRHVLGQGTAIASIGLVIGAALAVPSAVTLRALIASVEWASPLAYVGAAGTLLVVTLVACWLPARSAARVDPRAALSAE